MNTRLTLTAVLCTLASQVFAHAQPAAQSTRPVLPPSYGSRSAGSEATDPSSPHRFPLGPLTSRSALSVIDTTIVRNSAVVTRHVYSYDANWRVAADIKQDSIDGHWLNETRKSSSYDANGSVLSTTDEVWNDNAWTKYLRTTASYDVNGNQLERSMAQWIVLSGQWKQFSRQTYTWDTGNNMLSALTETLTGDSIRSDRFIQTFDSLGRRTSWLSETKRGGLWVGLLRCIVSYGNGGNVVSATQTWSGSDWQNSGRAWESRDAGNRILSSVGELWLNGQWVPGGQDDFTYDGNGRKTSGTFVRWANGTESKWRTSWTYTPGGEVLTFLREYWAAQWLPGSKLTYVYDPDGRMVSFLEEGMDINGWGPIKRGSYGYDAQGELASAGFEVWNNSSWHPLDYPTEDDAYPQDFILQEGQNVYSLGTGYHFDIIRKPKVGSPTDVHAHETDLPGDLALMQNFPNPFNPVTVIAYHLPESGAVTLTVHDLVGREVAVLVREYQTAGHHQAVFSIGDLASGAYTYTLTAGGIARTRKMIILK